MQKVFSEDPADQGLWIPLGALLQTLTVCAAQTLVLDLPGRCSQIL